MADRRMIWFPWTECCGFELKGQINASMNTLNSRVGFGQPTFLVDRDTPATRKFGISPHSPYCMSNGCNSFTQGTRGKKMVAREVSVVRNRFGCKNVTISTAGDDNLGI